MLLIRHVIPIYYIKIGGEQSYCIGSIGSVVWKKTLMDMELEQKQAEIIDELVRRASTCKGEALLPIIIEATSHPSLFAFSEILALPNVAQVFLHSRILA